MKHAGIVFEGTIYTALNTPYIQFAHAYVAELMCKKGVTIDNTAIPFNFDTNSNKITDCPTVLPDNIQKSINTVFDRYYKMTLPTESVVGTLLIYNSDRRFSFCEVPGVFADDFFGWSKEEYEKRTKIATSYDYHGNKISYIKNIWHMHKEMSEGNITAQEFDNFLWNTFNSGGYLYSLSFNFIMNSIMLNKDYEIEDTELVESTSTRPATAIEAAKLVEDYSGKKLSEINYNTSHGEIGPGKNEYHSDYGISMLENDLVALADENGPYLATIWQNVEGLKYIEPRDHSVDSITINKNTGSSLICFETKIVNDSLFLTGKEQH